MASMSADQIAQAWAAGLAAKSDKITAGVNAVTVAPGQLAARQKAVYVNNVTANADKWARNTSAVSVSEWQDAMKNKGIPRIATGAQAAIPKFTQFMNKLLPYQESAKASLPPRGTYEQNKARANAWMDKMHQFSNSR